MRDFTSSFSVERIQNSSTIVVTLRNVEYGSLREAELATLQNDLADVNDRLESARHVIVDLSELTMFGSAFLRILFDQLAPLKMLGIKVALCGDKTGLLALTAMNRWLTVEKNLDFALSNIEQSSDDWSFDSEAASADVLVRCA
jgi:hypothetical protein